MRGRRTFLPADGLSDLRAGPVLDAMAGFSLNDLSTHRTAEIGGFDSPSSRLDAASQARSRRGLLDGAPPAGFSCSAAKHEMAGDDPASRGPPPAISNAENGGFEPPRACTQHAFQACAIGH